MIWLASTIFVIWVGVIVALGVVLLICKIISSLAEENLLKPAAIIFGIVLVFVCLWAAGC